MIYVVLFAFAVVTLGGPLRRVVRAMRPGPCEPADPALLTALARAHPMERRPRVADSMGPWTGVPDGLEFQVLLAQVLAVTHG